MSAPPTVADRCSRRGRTGSPTARTATAGAECQAPLNEPSRHDAIHGLVRWLDWSLVAHESDHVTLSCAVRPQPAYEWQLDLEITYAVDASGLTVTLHRRQRRRASRRRSASGSIPTSPSAPPTVDDLDLTVPAAAFLDPDVPAETPRMLPVAGTPKDFTTARSDRRDASWTPRSASSRAVRTGAPSRGWRHPTRADPWNCGWMRATATSWSTPPTRSGGPTAAARGIAIEPMTCPPDAFRSGVDLIDLQPGATWRGSWGLRSKEES